MRSFSRAAVVVVLIAAAACSRTESENLALELIHVSGDARMRTDRLGSGTFEGTATFVLVDAANAADKGAYVTLGGGLTDEAGKPAGTLKPQSLWIPAGESRTFALVDDARQSRPAATAARVEVRGALVPADPPRARIEELHTFPNQDRVIVQAYLVNDADRTGQIMVVGAFHDASNRPMTRPFEMIEIAKKSRQVVKFIGPSQSVRGTIFVGDVIY